MNVFAAHLRLLESSVGRFRFGKRTMNFILAKIVIPNFAICQRHRARSARLLVLLELLGLPDDPVVLSLFVNYWWYCSGRIWASRFHQRRRRDTR